MGNTPKVQTDAEIPVEGVSPDTNVEGRTPHGTPEQTSDAQAKGNPTNERLATETAAVNAEQGKPELPKR